jgi:hypothetical protein
MRVSHFIIINVVALVAMFTIGCSKSIPNPVVRFQGYEVRHGGQIQANFEIKNPSQYMMACLLQIPTTDSHMIAGIWPRGSSSIALNVTQTNALSLSVTVMRLTPVRQFTVTTP